LKKAQQNWIIIYPTSQNEVQSWKKRFDLSRRPSVVPYHSLYFVLKVILHYTRTYEKCYKLQVTIFVLNSTRASRLFFLNSTSSASKEETKKRRHHQSTIQVKRASVQRSAQCNFVVDPILDSDLLAVQAVLTSLAYINTQRHHYGSTAHEDDQSLIREADRKGDPDRQIVADR
jgi:hypothetical protein